MSMTLATAWVRRGVAAEFPHKYEVDEAELGRIEKLARLQLADAQEDLDAAQNDIDGENEDSEDDDDEAGVPTGIQNGTPGTRGTTTDNDDDMREYNLSDYDDDEVDQETGERFAMFGNVRSLAYHQFGEEDPYLVLPEGEDSDNEREELQVLATDNMILAAKVEDEVPHLEILVYEDEADNIYVHHDIMLPAIPLCLEWLDVPVGKTNGDKKQGNFVAVGMMGPEIEVWDLDVVDSMYPAAILGQQPEEKEQEEKSISKDSKKKSKKKKKPKPNDSYHVDGVLSLSLNRHHRNLLASASADGTIKLWELNTGTCAKSYTQHGKAKITSLDWHPSPERSTILLSGSADTKTVVITDMRAPEATAPTWQVEADIERVKWNPHDPDFFYVTTEAGTVHYFNSRTPPAPNAPGISKPVFTLQAHDSAVTAFDINPLVSGFLATASEDKTVKLWNVVDNKPSMVVSRNLDVGRVFSAQFAPDNEVAFRLCIAGSKGNVQVWDTSTNAAVRKVFAGRAQLPAGDDVKERLVASSGGGGGEDEEEDESEEEDVAEDGAGQNGWESMEED
ncbi:rRNA-processing protein [Lithohypha guttulata]|uniref:rRNA-processing protein n=1 Tax=Lithohypha guttulata TaxID=1690604 RepID=UPI002DDE3124|nr:rRNA-processing protein [Lithohypha guttulata]